MRIIEILATLATIIGFYLISENQLLAGFGISIFANILWIVWAYPSKAFGIVIVNSALLFSSINGILGAI